MLLFSSITMSILAVLYMTVMQFLSNKYSEKFRYYTWLIIVIGLIIPLRPPWNNYIRPSSESVTPTLQFSMVYQDDVFIWNLDEIYIPQDNALLNHFDVPVTIEYIGIQANYTTSNINLWQIGFFIWLFGVISSLAYQGIKHYRFIRMVRRWSDKVTDETLISLFQNIKLKMGIERQISLETCPFIGTPLMIGLFKPRVLLPETYLSENELSFILHHELVHYKRNDLLYKYLVLLATSLHWFNPIVYLMAKSIRILCEMSCDVEVVENKDIDTRLSYTKTIIGVMRHQSRLQTALSTNFNGGKKGMKKRISSIMDTNKKRAGIAITGLFVALTLGTGVFLNAAPTEIGRTLNVELMEHGETPSATAIDIDEAVTTGVDAWLRYFNIDVTEEDSILMMYAPAAPTQGPTVWVGMGRDDTGGIHEEYTAIFMRAFEESGLTVSQFLHGDLSMFPFADGSRSFGGSTGFLGAVSQWIGVLNEDRETRTPGDGFFRVHGQTGQLISADIGATVTESHAGLEGEPTQAQIDNAIQYAVDRVESFGILESYNATKTFFNNAWAVLAPLPLLSDDEAASITPDEFRELQLAQAIEMVYASVIAVRIEDADGNYVHVTMTGILEDELRINSFVFLQESLEDEIAAIPQSSEIRNFFW